MTPQKRGFTLIELLVVVAIVGLLATVATIAISGASKKARDTKRKADLSAIQKALDLYYQENGSYPATPAAGGGGWCDLFIPGYCSRGTCSDVGSFGVEGANAYIPNLAPTYIGKLPREPKPLSSHPGQAGCSLNNSCYVYTSNGTDYKIIAHCDAETPLPAAGEPFHDPRRPGWATMLCNPFGAGCATW
jgi:prepilin-type N-terminal cleavage/methylation domain-containing protein